MDYRLQIFVIAILPASGLLSGCPLSGLGKTDFESGWSLVAQGEEPDPREAIARFEACIEANPDDAHCHAVLAIVYAFISTDYNITDPGKVSAKARNGAARVLELDDQLALTHFAMAEIQAGFDWNWSEAEARFQRAIELDPTHALAIEQCCFFLLSLGRLDEAGQLVVQLQSADPDRPIGFLEYLFTGYAGRVERSIAKLIKSDPKNLVGYWMGSCVSAREAPSATDAFRILEK